MKKILKFLSIAAGLCIVIILGTVFMRHFSRQKNVDALPELTVNEYDGEETSKHPRGSIVDNVSNLGQTIEKEGLEAIQKGKNYLKKNEKQTINVSEQTDAEVLLGRNVSKESVIGKNEKYFNNKQGTQIEDVSNKWKDLEEAQTLLIDTEKLINNQ